MHLCAVNGKLEETKCLISKGADVNLKVREKGILELHPSQLNVVHIFSTCIHIKYPSAICN
jgi:hypothetical protein